MNDYGIAVPPLLHWHCGPDPGDEATPANGGVDGTLQEGLVRVGVAGVTRQRDIACNECKVWKYKSIFHVLSHLIHWFQPTNGFFHLLFDSLPFSFSLYLNLKQLYDCC